MYVPACVYMHYIHVDTPGGQKRVSESPKLELEVVVGCPVWVLGTESKSSARVAPKQLSWRTLMI